MITFTGAYTRVSWAASRAFYCNNFVRMDDEEKSTTKYKPSRSANHSGWSTFCWVSHQTQKDLQQHLEYSFCQFDHSANMM